MLKISQNILERLHQEIEKIMTSNEDYRQYVPVHMYAIVEGGLERGDREGWREDWKVGR